MLTYEFKVDFMSSTSVIFFNLQIQLIFALFLSLTLFPSLQTHSKQITNIALEHSLLCRYCIKSNTNNEIKTLCLVSLCHVLYISDFMLRHCLHSTYRIKMYSICYTGCYQYIVVSVLVLVLVYCTMCLSVEKGIYNNGFESLFLFIHRYALNIYIFCGLSAIILNHL